MASKFRPSGSYKDYLYLSSQDISKLTKDALKGIVNKLNDAANKRLRRLEGTGLEMFSPSYRARKEENGLVTFTIEGDESLSRLQRKYTQVKNFLREEGYSTKKQIMEHIIKDNAALMEKVLGKPLSDPSNWDRRYKKKKVLRKPIQDKLSDFWQKYREWKEVQANKYPDSYKGDTNISDVENFEDEIYDSGKVTLSDMEQEATKKYETQQRKAKDETDISTLPSYGRGKKPTKQGKRQKRGKTIKQIFEKINIFDE